MTRPARHLADVKARAEQLAAYQRGRADEAQALLADPDLGEGHSPGPSPAPPGHIDGVDDYADDGDERCPAADGDLPSHWCYRRRYHVADHDCGKCSHTWPLSPAEHQAALDHLQGRAETLAAAAAAHSRQITDRLINPMPLEVVPLSPTIEGTVTRDPASEAIATAARRLVHRTGQQITEFNEEAWRVKKVALESRIATRLEDAGLSPAVVLKLTGQLLADVLAAAADVDSVLCEQVDAVMRADVARNLLPRISKVMKETRNG